MVRQQGEVNVTLLHSDEAERVPETGAVGSVQEAELTLVEDELDRLWTPETLERLARSYWRYLSRISLRLIRVIYSPDSSAIVLASRRIALLRFHAPEFEADSRSGVVRWRIERGLLVARGGREHGHLQISVSRTDAGSPPRSRVEPGRAHVRIRLEVRNFYPWLRGSGRFARLGTWIYARTQLRVHEAVCRGFLRWLADPRYRL